MIELDELRAKAKEYSTQAKNYSRKAMEISPTNREQGREFMKKARDASRRCQVLINEILRRDSKLSES